MFKVYELSEAYVDACCIAEQDYMVANAKGVFFHLDRNDVPLYYFVR